MEPDLKIERKRKKSDSRPRKKPKVRKQIGNYYMGKRISSGAQGKIYKGESLQGEKVILKQFSNEKYWKKEKEASISLWMYGVKKNFVPFKSELEGKKHKYLVYDYIDGDDLLTVINDLAKGTKEFTNSEMIQLIIDICAPIKRLNEKKLYHGDIKPENIMIEYLTREPYIIDLGSLCTFDCFEDIPMTMMYMPPELFRFRKRNYLNDEEKEYVGSNEYPTRRLDIYALGILIYVLTTGEYPSYEVNSAEKIFPNGIQTGSEELNELIARMIEKDYTKPYIQWEEIIEKLIAIETKINNAANVDFKILSK